MALDPRRLVAMLASPSAALLVLLLYAVQLALMSTALSQPWRSYHLCLPDLVAGTPYPDDMRNRNGGHDFGNGNNGFRGGDGNWPPDRPWGGDVAPQPGQWMPNNHRGMNEGYDQDRHGRRGFDRRGDFDGRGGFDGRPNFRGRQGFGDDFRGESLEANDWRGNDSSKRMAQAQRFTRVDIGPSKVLILEGGENAWDRFMHRTRPQSARTLSIDQIPQHTPVAISLMYVAVGAIATETVLALIAVAELCRAFRVTCTEQARLLLAVSALLIALLGVGMSWGLLLGERNDYRGIMQHLPLKDSLYHLRSLLECSGGYPTMQDFDGHPLHGRTIWIVSCGLGLIALICTLGRSAALGHQARTGTGAFRDTLPLSRQEADYDESAAGFARSSGATGATSILIGILAVPAGICGAVWTLVCGGRHVNTASRLHNLPARGQAIPYNAHGDQSTFAQLSEYERRLLSTR
ncbi:hypothetical protein CAOG_04460 [Capsaspora owczarzaki ATCC 30864]|uniref:Uncharacterized protein n=1 Tax=Capsaspora owczarzaki (strain ATCC 30864) TaxID=595528 RepID=A0A0D2UF34_CAPO3|nr:hypothetical protein CAOG_04460 [Capsaspora owczarzaki ATCC 30864]KJE93706.1 hypothetical protein CAOG_004460 [Capsaspora owczarzaki ATCC 30864]|eukprot:XP_004348288.2 hypothetical protein CAOG_04460 [Capsaspora owczarzaki ATCC 30864]